ncbi:sugar O-acetyltransferase [Parendozoicomonas haliclonae]|uniref:Acetyltransferase n=1 Tax=Parendozoicomonas haliclonae TaxID=1960125 RepID=A0A1X7AMR9_9GAMM|nr:sugar O-acetyltransferase [Parendozoicomonas haliclonae]SMA49598.1 Maltose O-acetyltransferase [Parendozoicomonas haliclonae]
MTEKEKMLAGLPYDAWEETLLNERTHAKVVCHRFNHADPAKPDERMAILGELLVIKDKAHMEPNFFCDYGYNITLGSNFYANHNLTIVDVCPVTFGDNILIGPHVMISAGGHPVDPVERMSVEFGKPVSIGNNVWIGGNVSILPGVEIGDNCVIGAGSVVNKSIPANSVAVGNPCRVIKTVA